VCDTGNHVIRRVATNGLITTVAGTGKDGYSGDRGPALKAELNEPYEVRFDKAGNMYFVEMRNHVVRRVDAETQTITTLAGTGKADIQVTVAQRAVPCSTNRIVYNSTHAVTSTFPIS
jgi:hypothetical protein